MSGREGERPGPFHVLVKPAGPICNLDCGYCFYLSKEDLYPSGRFRMADSLLEEYLSQLLGAHSEPEVTLAWQGGEPTLMGLDFFRRAVEMTTRFLRPGQTVEHTIQTNGTLLNDAWASFFKEHNFLVGVSVDGPAQLHNEFRVDKRGRESFSRVMVGLGSLQRHGVEYNLLCTVNAANQDYPREVYRFLRDDCGAQFIQFIPVVEPPSPGDGTVFSVDSEKWGYFLAEVFDEWFRADVGSVFVQIFESALAAWMDLPSPMCIFSETCGRSLALEHNGDLYSCDHFVDPEHLLGNIRDHSMGTLVASPTQRRFGEAKRSSLPKMCLECDVRFACNGECPKNRIIVTPDGEPGLNYLCAGYKYFFHLIDAPMRLLASILRSGGRADQIYDVTG